MGNEANDRRLLLSPQDRIAKTISALLIVDLQNDFCAKGGYISKLGIDTSVFDGLPARVARLLDMARVNDVPVIWVFADYADHLVPTAMLARKQQNGIEEACCESGSWGAQPFSLASMPDELIITKHSYDAFHNTGLHDALQVRGIETLVVVGVQTNVCVESAVRHAHSLGYYVVLAEDCVMSHMAAEHQASMATMKFLFADVLTSEAIAEQWANKVPGQIASSGQFTEGGVDD